MILFEVQPEMSAEDANTLPGINSTLKRLADRRLEQIVVEGSLLKSKLAWKIATYQQSVLYRVVALASGCALNWNASNQLCSILATRALIETIALPVDFENQLRILLDRDDLAGVNQLVMRLTFSTCDEIWLRDHPDCEAVSVLTLIDKLAKSSGLDGMRRIYDDLSERCHPNSYGHHFFFSTLDTSTGTTTYSERKHYAENLNSVLLSMLLIVLAEKAINGLDSAINRTAELQHRLDYVGGKG